MEFADNIQLQILGFGAKNLYECELYCHFKCQKFDLHWFMSNAVKKMITAGVQIRGNIKKNVL